MSCPTCGRKMPKQKPGQSKQDYGTPGDFLRAVESAFGELGWDLACSPLNCRGQYGGFTAEDNALLQPWSDLLEVGLLWLNPPFGRIKPWAKKCAEESERGAQILMLVPASVGSNWFRDYVHPYAKVLTLSPRLVFEGCKDPFPKDLILCCYGFGATGLEPWAWKE